MLFVQKYFLLFIFYAFIGWILESTYCSIGAMYKSKKFTFINRGFLFGPVVPIYAVCAVLMALTLMPFRDRWYLVALIGLVVCDGVEYFTSWIMEKLFHARWWDYSKQPFNIQGRICLRNSLFWAVLSVIFIELIHPHVLELYEMIPEGAKLPLFTVLLVIFSFDLGATVATTISIRDLQASGNKIWDKLKIVASEKWNDMKEQTQESLRNSKEELEAEFQDTKAALEYHSFESTGEDLMQLLQETREGIQNMPKWKRRRIRHMVSIHPVILELPRDKEVELKQLHLSEDVKLQLNLTRMEMDDFFKTNNHEYF